jgi:uncharacterized membrane protein
MIGGDVPYPIPISWYYMLVCCLAFCAQLLASDDSSRTKWKWALVSGAFLTAWDVPMEVQMTNVQPAHWVWDLDKFPAWMPEWLGGPLFYGMPLTNWIGWYFTGVVVSRLMLAIVPPSKWRVTTAAMAFPLVLYATNGIMPIATVARHGYVWSALLGVLAMGTPLWLVMRARKQAAATLGVAPATA